MTPTSEYLGGGPFDDLSRSSSWYFIASWTFGVPRAGTCWVFLLRLKSFRSGVGCRSRRAQLPVRLPRALWRGEGWGLRVCPAAAAGLLAVTLSRLLFLLRALRGLDNDRKLPSPRPDSSALPDVRPGPRLAFGDSRTS